MICNWRNYCKRLPEGFLGRCKDNIENRFERQVDETVGLSPAIDLSPDFSLQSWVTGLFARFTVNRKQLGLPRYRNLCSLIERDRTADVWSLSTKIRDATQLINSKKTWPTFSDSTNLISKVTKEWKTALTERKIKTENESSVRDATIVGSLQLRRIIDFNFPKIPTPKSFFTIELIISDILEVTSQSSYQCQ